MFYREIALRMRSVHNMDNFAAYQAAAYTVRDTLIERWKRVYLTLVDVVFLLGAAGVAVGSTVLVTTAHSVLDEIHCW